MEKKNNCMRVGFSTILWVVLAILLCAAPAGWAVTFDDGGEHDIDYAIYLDSVEVGNATVNLLPGAYIDWFVYTTNNSVVNIKGGTVGLWIDVAPDAEVTVYGTGFNLGEGEHFIDYGTVIGSYDNGDPINLTFDCQPDATVTLAATGGGGPTPIYIDIKPGSFPNSINLGSHGVIPVAIFSTADFDATTLNPENIFLAGSGVRVRGKGNKYLVSEEDVNGDGLMDLVVKVETENLDPTEFKDDGAFLRVHENSDQESPVLYEGWDEIRIVPRRRGKGHS